MKRFSLRQDRGSTAIEYTLIVCVIAIMTIATLTSVGTTLKTFFTNASAPFVSAPAPAR
jgi:Flp pilus assembly pilin Flp